MHRRPDYLTVLIGRSCACYVYSITDANRTRVPYDRFPLNT